MANKEIKDFAQTTTPAGTDKILIQNAAGTTEYQTRTQLKKLFGTEVFDTDTSVKMAFQIGGSEKMRINTNGDLLIGTTTSPTGAGKVLVFGDNAGNPTMGSNTCGVYGKDVSGTVEVFVVDEGSSALQISPHDPEGRWAPLKKDRGGPWHRVRMYRVIELLEEMTGEQLIVPAPEMEE